MPLLKWILGLCVCLFMVSCAESDKERLSKLVKEWEGKEILFPAHSTFTIQGKDTVDFDFMDAEYKVVTYIDSIGCTSCKLQLPRWKKLMTEVDSLTDGGVSFLIYFYPKDKEELCSLMRRDAFIYPVCFDWQDKLNRLNKVPPNSAFQTFLLDKDNKVVAIGNPALNPLIKELYLEVIKNDTKTSQVGNITTVSVDRMELEFGNFPVSEQQERSFMLTNTGNSLLVIQDVTTSCGCTKVEYAKEPVRPGGILELKVIYESERAERFHKTVMVYGNMENSPLRLTIKGIAN